MRFWQRDPVGAMYGGLDLAEAVRLGTLSGITSDDHAPFIANRGIKFNIPGYQGLIGH